MTSQRTFGLNGPTVSSVGLGCMGMSAFYGGHSNTENNVKVLKSAYDLGCTHWDTADVYGTKGHGENEKLIGDAVRSLSLDRSKLFIATKFGSTTNAEGQRIIRGDKEYVREALNNSLTALGLDYVDLYYQHRVDSKVPIEETVEAMESLRKEGKIRHLGLSECSAETLRKAHKVAPISSVEVEYSLFTLDIETNGLLDTCKELGIAIVAYSPLGRGMLSGSVKSRDDLPQDDYRRYTPRFSEENFPKNLELVAQVEKLAKNKGCTSGQLALAWVLAQWDGIFVIPGTTREQALKENVEAANVKLTKEELAEIRTMLDQFLPAGDRYPPASMKALNL